MEPPIIDEARLEELARQFGLTPEAFGKEALEKLNRDLKALLSLEGQSKIRVACPENGGEVILG